MIEFDKYLSISSSILLYQPLMNYVLGYYITKYLSIILSSIVVLQSKSSLFYHKTYCIMNQQVLLYNQLEKCQYMLCNYGLYLK